MILLNINKFSEISESLAKICICIYIATRVAFFLPKLMYANQRPSQTTLKARTFGIPLIYRIAENENI